MVLSLNIKKNKPITTTIKMNDKDVAYIPLLILFGIDMSKPMKESSRYKYYLYNGNLIEDMKTKNYKGGILKEQTK